MPRFGEGYEHIDDAAAAALMLLARQPRAERYEYMGLLIRDPDTGLIYRTDFQTQGSRDASSWTGFPEGEIAGLVHNHPAPRPGDKYPSTHFSRTDVAMAADTGAPSFVSAMQGQGAARDVKYTPRKSHKGMTKPGKPLLAIIPIDELLQFHAARNPLMAAYLAQRDQGQMVAANGNPNTR